MDGADRLNVPHLRPALRDTPTLHLALRTVTRPARPVGDGRPEHRDGVLVDALTLLEAARELDGTVVLQQDVRYPLGSIGGVHSTGGR